MKYISLILTAIFLITNTALAGWITSNRGATIESSTSDAKKFVFLLYSQGSQTAALSMYDDLPKDEVKNLQIDPLKITGNLELIHDIYAGIYKSAAKQRMIEARVLTSSTNDEKNTSLCLSQTKGRETPFSRHFFLPILGLEQSTEVAILAFK